MVASAEIAYGELLVVIFISILLNYCGLLVAPATMGTLDVSQYHRAWISALADDVDATSVPGRDERPSFFQVIAGGDGVIGRDRANDSTCRA